MKRLRLIAAGLGLLIAAGPALAAGVFWGLPQIGGAAYCAGMSVLSPIATGGIPLTAAQVAAAQALGLVNCNTQAPAGPALFQGTSVVPVDIYGPQAVAPAPNTYPTSVYVGLNQMGQGRYQFLSASAGTAAANTIPDNVSWHFVAFPDQTSAFTIKMPPNPVEGQIQHVVCANATTGTMTVAANTSVVTQVLIGNPNAQCVAGVGYKWRYAAATLTWYRF